MADAVADVAPLQGSGDSANMSDADDDGQDTFVWGTNLAIASVTRRIRNFYTSYYAEGEEAGGGEAKYQALLRQVCTHLHSTHLVLDREQSRCSCQVIWSKDRGKSARRGLGKPMKHCRE